MRAGHSEHGALAAPVDPALVRASIITVLNQRRVQVLQDQPGAIYARMGRGPTLDLQIDYTGAGYAIQYAQSQGFEQGVDPQTGEPLYDSRYVGWIRKLKILVDREIAAQRAAEIEAEEDRREQELEVALAHQRAEEAALEREREARYAATQPQVAPNQAGGATTQLRAGFNITREPNGLGSATVVIVNQAAEDFHRITMRRAHERQWRPNQLQTTLNVGARMTLTGLDSGTWELRVEDLRGYKEWHDLHLRGGGEYTVLITSQGWYAR